MTYLPFSLALLLFDHYFERPGLHASPHYSDEQHLNMKALDPSPRSAI